MFRPYTKPRSSWSRWPRPDLSLIFASFLPFPNLHARRLPDLVGVSKRTSASSARLTHFRPGITPNVATESSDSDRRHLLIPLRLPLTTRALQQSKIRAKIILCFHALTNGIFTKSFPLLCLQIRGGCFSDPYCSLATRRFRNAHSDARNSISCRRLLRNFLDNGGPGALRRSGLTPLCHYSLPTAHYPLLTILLQYPRPLFVYSKGWTSR